MCSINELRRNGYLTTECKFVEPPLIFLQVEISYQEIDVITKIVELNINPEL